MQEHVESKSEVFARIVQRLKLFWKTPTFYTSQGPKSTFAKIHIESPL